MTTDLVERLRNDQVSLIRDWDVTRDTLREAADEIERLYGLRDHWSALVEEHEAEIERLRAEKYVVVSGDSLRNDNEELQAEIERLELRVAELEIALDFAEGG